MAVLFRGDYSTGDFGQWAGVQNTSYNGPPAGYVEGYWAQITTSDPPAGATFAARFELRDGDTAAGTNERTEVQGDRKSVV